MLKIKSIDLQVSISSRLILNSVHEPNVIKRKLKWIY